MKHEKPEDRPKPVKPPSPYHPDYDPGPGHCSNCGEPTRRRFTASGSIEKGFKVGGNNGENYFERS